MQSSDISKIVANEWIKPTKIRNNIELGKLVVMPNHFHGIAFYSIAVIDKNLETHSNASLRCS